MIHWLNTPSHVETENFWSQTLEFVKWPVWQAAFDIKTEQDTGYHRDILCPPTLLTMPLRRNTAHFLERKFHQIFKIFEIQKISVLLQNPKIGETKRHVRIYKPNIFFGFWAKRSLGLSARNFQTFGEKILAGLSKLHSVCTEEHFKLKYFLEKIIVFKLFSDFERNFFSDFWQFSPKLDSTCLEEKFEEK